MIQFSFKPRALLLAAAFSAAGIVNAQTTDSTPAIAATTPETDSSAATDVTSMDRTILAASGSAAHSTKASKSKPASTNQTHVASATSRTSSRTQSKNAATLNPADTAYRAELRSCAQMQGGERNSCLDRAIEHHAQS